MTTNEHTIPAAISASGARYDEITVELHDDGYVVMQDTDGEIVALSAPQALVLLALLREHEPVAVRGGGTLCQPLAFEVFDVDPAASGPCDWDTSEGPDPDDYTDPSELADAALDWAVSEAVASGEYETGDELFVLVRLPDGTNLKRSRALEIGGLDKLIKELESEGYSVQESNGGLLISVTDGPQGDGSEVDGEPELEAIRAIAARHGADAEWTGNGNTDADGSSTSDVSITMPD